MLFVLVFAVFTDVASSGFVSVNSANINCIWFFFLWCMKSSPAVFRHKAAPAGWHRIIQGLLLGVCLRFTRHGGFHMRFHFSFFVIGDVVKFHIIRSVRLGFCCFSLRLFCHVRPYFTLDEIWSGRRLDLRQPDSCPQMSFGWGVLQICNSCASKPGSR